MIYLSVHFCSLSCLVFPELPGCAVCWLSIVLGYIDDYYFTCFFCFFLSSFSFRYSHYVYFKPSVKEGCPIFMDIVFCLFVLFVFALNSGETDFCLVQSLLRTEYLGHISKCPLFSSLILEILVCSMPSRLL